MVMLGHLIQVDAAVLAHEEWSPSSPSGHVDQWTQWSRWRRGVFGRGGWYKLVLLLFAMASLATAGLGTYASVESLISAFGAANSVYTSFGCASPV